MCNIAVTISWLLLNALITYLDQYERNERNNRVIIINKQLCYYFILRGTASFLTSTVDKK